MAVRVPDLTFVDPFDGLSDLAAGVLRTPIAPERSFDDDPLRMMRAARFAAQLSFHVEPGTLAALVAMAGRIEIVSAERVQAEITKLLLSDNPRAGLEVLVDTGLAEQVLPELPALQRVSDIALQCGAATDGVEADRNDPRQSRGDEKRREEGRVLQQHAHVWRLIGIHSRPKGRGDRGTLSDVVAPRRERILEVHTAVVDLDQRCDQRGYGGKLAPGKGIQAGVSARSRPMCSSAPVAPPTANSACLAARK